MGYILILGAKSDIAKSISRQYAELGSNLFLAARNVHGLEDFAADISIRYMVKVKCIELDILDYASHKTTYDELGEAPSGVISFIGYLGDQEKSQTSFNEAQKIINSNFTGLVSMLNIIANDFEKRKSGFIVGISSVAGDRGRKGNYTYGSAKAAFTTYLSGLRNRLHQANVKVLTVKPGFVNTKMTESIDLPQMLTAQPDFVAKEIVKAQRKGKDILYTLWIWRWIMLIIRHIPERLFKRMDI